MVERLLAELPSGFKGRVVFRVGRSGDVKVKVSSFLKMPRRAELKVTGKAS
jgi:hypothetical protein